MLGVVGRSLALQGPPARGQDRTRMARTAQGRVEGRPQGIAIGLLAGKGVM
jgi:hypothetical protein